MNRGNPNIGSETWSIGENEWEDGFDNAYVSDLGGIDLRANKMDIETKGALRKPDVDLALTAQGIGADSIDSLTPVILDINYISNLPDYLGLSR